MIKAHLGFKKDCIFRHGEDGRVKRCEEITWGFDEERLSEVDKVCFFFENGMRKET